MGLEEADEWDDACSQAAFLCFHRFLKDTGSSDYTAKRYPQLLRILFNMHRRSLKAMADPQYQILVRQSRLDRDRHRALSCALLKFRAFYDSGELDGMAKFRAVQVTATCKSVTVKGPARHDLSFLMEAYNGASDDEPVETDGSEIAFDEGLGALHAAEAEEHGLPQA